MDLEILKIASDTKNHKFLKDSSHFAKFKNPLCGDEMNVSLMVKGEKITDFAYECKSCIYCQACLLYTSPSPRDGDESRMPSSA